MIFVKLFSLDMYSFFNSNFIYVLKTLMPFKTKFLWDNYELFLSEKFQIIFSM